MRQILVNCVSVVTTHMSLSTHYVHPSFESSMPAGTKSLNIQFTWASYHMFLLPLSITCYHSLICIFQVFFPFIVAGFGTVGAGMVLDIVQVHVYYSLL